MCLNYWNWGTKCNTFSSNLSRGKFVAAIQSCFVGSNQVPGSNIMKHYCKMWLVGVRVGLAIERSRVRFSPAALLSTALGKPLTKRCLCYHAAWFSTSSNGQLRLQLSDRGIFVQAVHWRQPNFLFLAFKIKPYRENVADVKISY